MILGITASGFSGGLSASDNFNRVDGALGSTSTNNLTWQTLSGTFLISSNKAVSSPTSATTGAAVVDTYTPNVNISLDVSSVGGDAIYFRATDANNWWRVGVSAYSTVTYVPTGYTEYYWCSYLSGAEYYPNSAQAAAGCWQTYHDHNSTWPTQCGWGTSSTSPPASIAYANVTHSHSIVLAQCNQTVTFSHTHVSSSYSNGQTRFVTTGTTAVPVTYTSVELQKSIGGVISNVDAFVATPSSLQVIANGSSIIIRVDNNVTNRLTITSTDHLTATKHGFGRAPTTNVGTSIDNFSVTAITA